MRYEVKIAVFEGPFDLLLQCILRQELDIHEVPIAQITSAYLEHLEAVPELDLDTATEFLMIAATLLLIKARSLIPRPEDELELLEDTETAREFLIERLVEYKKYSNAAEWLADLYGEHGWYMPRLRELEDDYSHLYPDPFEGVSVVNLPEALIELLIERLTDQVDTAYIAPIKVSVEEHIGRVRKYLAPSRAGTFSELVADCRSKLDVVATFLAVLELYKRGELSLSQRRPFGDIKIVMSEGNENSAA